MNRRRNRLRWLQKLIIYSFLTVLVSIPALIIVSFPISAALDRAHRDADITAPMRYNQPMQHRELIQQIERDQVVSILINANHSRAAVTTKQGGRFIVGLSNDLKLIELLNQHQVDVTVDPSAHPPRVLIFLILLPFLGVLAGSFLWVWSLVDCATNEAEEGNTKTIWILIIIFVSWVGALMYLLIRRPQRLQEFRQ